MSGGLWRVGGVIYKVWMDVDAMVRLLLLWWVSVGVLNLRVAIIVVVDVYRCVLLPWHVQASPTP